jgi:hypothetical protein
MRFRRVRDVLDWTRSFHTALAEEYERLAYGHEKERVGLLLLYMAEHERTLGAALERYEEGGEHRVLEIGYAPDLQLPDDMQSVIAQVKNLDTQAVMQLAVTFHEELVQFYRGLAEHAPNAEVQALFEDIAAHEIREKIDAVRHTEEFEDV